VSTMRGRLLATLSSRASTVVTGATAGIGRDFAIQLAGAGFNVFLASRTASKLEEISAEISTFLQ
jgi:17beta-estradiol 17-dehydrogenase / very-long-chain 3-oxoacyl-CoA reductase